MNKLLLIFGLLIFLNCTLIAQDRTWQTYTPRNGNWSILAPGVMRPDQEALKAKSRQGSFTYNDFNGFFAVIYKDYSKINFLFGKSGHFTKQRDIVIKANKGKLIKDQEFTNGNISGREVHMQMPDNRVIPRESSIKLQHRVQRFRMFFVGSRFYIILAVLPETDVNLPEITQYLNSFTLK